MGKLTRWEAGQDLIACVDYIGEKEVDLFDAGYAAEAAVLKKARLMIGKHFNKMKTHSFGLSVPAPKDSEGK